MLAKAVLIQAGRLSFKDMWQDVYVSLLYLILPATLTVIYVRLLW